MDQQEMAVHRVPSLFLWNVGETANVNNGSRRKSWGIHRPLNENPFNRESCDYRFPPCSPTRNTHRSGQSSLLPSGNSHKPRRQGSGRACQLIDQLKATRIVHYWENTGRDSVKSGSSRISVSLYKNNTRNTTACHIWGFWKITSQQVYVSDCKRCVL